MKILFAAMPAEGHFNPLTGIAMHLKAAGHDVRWYAAPKYIPKLERLGIPFYPFVRAREVDVSNIAELYPERAKLRGLALIRFDGNVIFVSDVGNHFEDVRDIDATFPFDVLFCDDGFYAMKPIKDKLGKQVCAVSVAPVLEADDNAPPNFMGLRPATNPFSRLAQRGMRAMMDVLVMNQMKDSFNAVLAAHDVAPIEDALFDFPYRYPDVVFQSGAPGFAYPRRKPNPKIQYVGALLPYKATIAAPFAHADKLAADRPVIFISQGTVEKDASKLIVPALEALKDTGALLVVTTGYGQTEALRAAYAQDHIIIEDFVDFDFILDRADLFICNGGYGSVLFSLSKGVPILGAGVQEGKNDVNAHVDYFEVGIDLRSERPKPADIRAAAQRLLTEPRYRQNAARLRDELNRYHPFELIDAYLAETNGHA
jgi:UDP:flavonoid glycosyltransferase YjiC (YdhE family)